MASADILPDGAGIRIQAAWMEKDLVRSIPGARFSESLGYWTAPLSWGAAWALRGIFGNNLIIGEDLKAWAAQEWETRVEPSLRMRVAMDWEGDERLYSYQRAGVAFMATAQRALVGDEMGTGKTVQAIMALQDIGAEVLPAMVVCPNSMTRPWIRELEKWAPEARTILCTGSAVARRRQIAQVQSGEVDILVVNYEKLRLHSRLAPYGNVALRKCEVCETTATGKQSSCERCEKELNEIPWQTVILDEAHRVKSPEAKQTRASWHLGKNAPFRFAMTGTPVTGQLDSLWSILHFVAPDDWPSKGAFIERYCLTSYTPWGSREIIGLNPNTKDEFFAILEPRFIRRTKAMVLPDLPPKVYERRDVDLTPGQRRVYKQLATDMIAQLDEGGIAAVTDPLTQMLRLLQCTSGSMKLDDEGNWRMTTPSSKLEALMDIIEQTDDLQQIAVFAESRQLIQLAEQLLAKEGIPYASIHGKVIPAERALAIDRLNAGEIKVLLLTLGAGGEGLTLTAADVLVFLERSYSLVKNLQAEDRLHRIGQIAEQVTIIDVIAEGTLDEERLAAGEGKARTLQEVVQDEAALRKMLETI
jgi:SNF2 family DNA or RNA helicase